MKHSFFITILCAIFSSAIVSASEIDLQDIKFPPSPRRVSTCLVSASINATDLAVYFESPVGVVIITVYNEFDQIIDQQTVNTEATTEVVIPADSWLSGNYTLTITYDTTILSGEFLTE